MEFFKNVYKVFTNNNNTFIQNFTFFYIFPLVLAFDLGFTPLFSNKIFKKFIKMDFKA